MHASGGVMGRDVRAKARSIQTGNLQAVQALAGQP